MIASPLQNSLETEKVPFENFMVSRYAFIETDLKAQEFEGKTSNTNFQSISLLNAIIKILFVALKFCHAFYITLISFEPFFDPATLKVAMSVPKCRILIFDPQLDAPGRVYQRTSN